MDWDIKAGCKTNQRRGDTRVGVFAPAVLSPAVKTFALGSNEKGPFCQVHAVGLQCARGIRERVTRPNGPRDTG